MIRDILSNFQVTGLESFLDGNTNVTLDGVNVPQDLGRGTTTYMEFAIADNDQGSPTIEVIRDIQIRYSNISDISHFNNDADNIAADSVIDPGNIGNKIINLLTGEPVTFPHDLSTDGPLYLGVQINNPLTFRYGFVRFMTDDEDVPMAGACFAGPLKDASISGIKE